jgi:hypothetical protein
MMLPCGFSRLGGTVHESSLCFEATLIPSAPSPLLRGALAGAPQDEAKAVEGRGLS